MKKAALALILAMPMLANATVPQKPDTKPTCMPGYCPAPTCNPQDPSNDGCGIFS